MFSAGIARKHEEKRVLENAQIEVPGQGWVGGGYPRPDSTLFHTPGGQRSAAADPEGFAHSAAAERRRERRSASAAAKAGHGRVRGCMEMSLWLESGAHLRQDML